MMELHDELARVSPTLSAPPVEALPSPREPPAAALLRERETNDSHDSMVSRCSIHATRRSLSSLSPTSFNPTHKMSSVVQNKSSGARHDRKLRNSLFQPLSGGPPGHCGACSELGDGGCHLLHLLRCCPHLLGLTFLRVWHSIVHLSSDQAHSAGQTSWPTNRIPKPC
jgi:hypothetical protein